MPKILFFLGKGGVGKSTVSSLTSLYLANQNKEVVLSSLDAAHNLSDIFEISFSDKPTLIGKNLGIIEINQDKWIKKYLRDVERQFSKAYSYLTTFSLENNFSIIRHAPGIEEYAILLAFQEVVKKNQDKDYLVFDMPPTALTLKFFALPQLSLLWLEKLMELRQEISTKQKIISTLQIGKKTLERDRVIQNIDQQIKFWNKIDQLFKNKNISFPFLVQNPDVLSKNEGELIEKKMNTLKMPSLLQVLNKAKSDEKGKYILSLATDLNPLGLENLKNIQRISNFDSFMEILK